MNNSIRTFIAVPAGGNPILAGEARRIRQALGEERFRWVDPSLFHFTLIFLGETDPKLIQPLSRNLEAVAGSLPGGSLGISGTGYFGRKNAPSVLWMGLEDDGYLRQLWSAVSGVVEELLPKKIENRFSPHLTLARIKTVRDTPLFHRVAGAGTGGRVIRLDVDRIVLFRSDLRPDGPVYTPLSEFFLK